jgi:diaminopimelate epimerase
MKKIPFIKMHGAGNDFVFLTRDNFKAPMTPKLAERLLDRHFGIGGDQLLLLSDAKKGQTPSLVFYNSDGSQAEMCGNGTRAVAAYLRDEKGFRHDFQIKTQTRSIGIGVKGKNLEVDMGEPVLDGRKIPVDADSDIRGLPFSVAGRSFEIYGVSMGNPHCVIFVDDVAAFPVGEIGPQIETHPFFPKRVNVEFVQVMSRSRVRARVWERGAGETLACGTGACAIAVASVRAGCTNRTIAVDLPGGKLGARWAENNHVYLTGPTETTFKGEFLLK